MPLVPDPPIEDRSGNCVECGKPGRCEACGAMPAGKVSPQQEWPHHWLSAPGLEQCQLCSRPIFCGNCIAISQRPRTPKKRDGDPDVTPEKFGSTGQGAKP